MIMIILEYTCVEVIRGWYIDSTVKKKKTRRICRPVAIYEDVFFNSRVTGKH